MNIILLNNLSHSLPKKELVAWCMWKFKYCLYSVDFFLMGCIDLWWEYTTLFRIIESERIKQLKALTPLFPPARNREQFVGHPDFMQQTVKALLQPWHKGSVVMRWHFSARVGNKCCVGAGNNTFSYDFLNYSLHWKPFANKQKCMNYFSMVCNALF